MLRHVCMLAAIGTPDTVSGRDRYRISQREATCCFNQVLTASSGLPSQIMSA